MSYTMTLKHDSNPPILTTFFFFSSSFYKVLEVHNLKTNFSYIINCKET